MKSSLDNAVFIYLDDIRIAPSKRWETVRTTEAAYQAVLDHHKAGHEIVLSLDHDLGEGIPTGYDLLNWLEKDIVTDSTFRPNIAFLIHSANPVGRDNMMRAIKSIQDMLS